MYTYEGHMMHDAWYFVDDHTDIVHMFHLAEPLNGGPSFVGHAISRDLVTWERLPTALRPRPARFLGRPPSLHRKRDRARRPVLDGLLRHRLQRQHPRRAVPRPTRRNGRLRRRTTWTKLPENPVTEAVSPHYERMGTGSAQDEPLARPLPVRQLRGCLPASLRPQGRRPYRRTRYRRAGLQHRYAQLGGIASLGARPHIRRDGSAAAVQHRCPVVPRLLHARAVPNAGTRRAIW